MRRFLLAAVMMGAMSTAHAADLPVLRGGYADGLSSTTRTWDGWYGGGQVSYESGQIDFSNTLTGLSNAIFRNSVLQAPTAGWSVLNKVHAEGSSFGAFAGRNWQWEDAVLGVEANYNYMNHIQGSSSNSLSLAIANPAGTSPPPNHSYTYNTTLTGAASLQVKDVLTFRGRAGWAFDCFMPYMFGGVAVGRMDVSRSMSSNVILRDDQTVTTTDIFGNTTTTSLAPVFFSVPSLSTTASEARSSDFVAGWTAGLGFDYMVWGNVFMRGEWEYTQFMSVKGTAVSLNGVRAGLGYRF